MAWRRYVVLMAIALGGCNHTPPPPARISLDGLSCVASPVMTTAQSLPLDEGKAVTVDLETVNNCLQGQDGSKSAYVLFALPASPTTYLLTVKSIPVGSALFSPHLALLDTQGQLIREIKRDSFSFHGSALYVGIRAAPTDRYLLVASDPQSVGQTISQVAEGTETRTAYGGVFYMQYSVGSDASINLTYAHNGKVTVTAQPMPKAN
jgi:hypothetical protein